MHALSPVADLAPRSHPPCGRRGRNVRGALVPPSSQYLLLPDKARPVAPLVSINDKTDRTGPNGSGIYMVDILLRKANLLEQVIPSINGDATLVPEQAVNPVGVSEAQRQQSSSLDMTRSQQIAAAVA